MGGNSLELCHGKAQVGYWGKSFMERAESPSLEGFKNLFKADLKVCTWHLETWVRGGLGSAGQLLSSTLEGFSSLHDSMI